MEPLARPLPMPMAICEEGLPFTGPISKRAYTVRGGGAGAGGAAAGEDVFFFNLDAAWLNEGRCPGGRPSVSKN